MITGFELAQLAFPLCSLMLMVGSLIAWGTVVQHQLQGRSLIPPRLEPAPVPFSPFAVLISLLWIGFHLYTLFTVTRPEFDPESVSQSVRGTAVIGLFLILWLSGILVVGAPTSAALDQWGFHGDQGARQVSDGACGFLLSFAPVFLVLFLSMPLRSEEVTHPFLRLLNSNQAELAWIALAAVVIAPLQEELMFRVVLQTFLVRLCGVWLGVLGTAIVFAAVHGFPDMLGILPLALVLGVLYQQRRSYLAIVITHALFNAYNLWATLMQTNSV